MRNASAEIGYPVMLKAAAGGGGKGNEVTSEGELQSAFEAARSEAASAFGNSDVYVEKVVEKPRHIEIQIFADRHGNYVHLGERECSIQRRHQKVIEECPSPINDPDLRQCMGDAAIRIARSVNYVGAGTVEFLYSDVTRDFYFLEMNTRLQVEHPVTELVTGLDLVREQIYRRNAAFLYAARRSLAVTPSNVVFTQKIRRTISCRRRAKSRSCACPPAGIRDDGGVAEGDEVSIYYDPMISNWPPGGERAAKR
jgi:acetyl-CoA carboxylase biotin carboxylase subunit